MSLPKLAILDKDGTLVGTKSGQTFVQNPYDQRRLPGALQQVKWLVENGYNCAIASNQGGVGAGFKSLYSVNSEIFQCLQLFKHSSTGQDEEFAKPGTDYLIELALFCPDKPETPAHESIVCIRLPRSSGYQKEFTIDGVRQAFEVESDFRQGFRKPAPGMLQLAMEMAGKTKFEHVVMIGDRPEDRQAAEAAGIDFWDAEQWRNGDYASTC